MLLLLMLSALSMLLLQLRLLTWWLLLTLRRELPLMSALPPLLLWRPLPRRVLRQLQASMMV